jgi:hypothetical protein
VLGIPFYKDLPGKRKGKEGGGLRVLKGESWIKNWNGNTLFLTSSDREQLT